VSATPGLVPAAATATVLNRQRHATFTPLPYKGTIDALKAVIRFGPEALPIPEFLMLLFHAERGLTFGKASDASSQAQQDRGVYQRKGQDVTFIRFGSGLKTNAKRANRALESRGLLRRTLRASENSGNVATEYTVLWEAVHRLFAEKEAQKKATLRSHRPKGGWSRRPKPIGSPRHKNRV
jgi:hypothetical protein